MSLNKSLVKQAAADYVAGQYRRALNVYHELADKIGYEFFNANIKICQSRLEKSGRRDCTDLPLAEIKVACVMDEFTFHSYHPECQLFQLSPEHVVDELQAFNPDLLFIESAWRGKDNRWDRKIGTLSEELRAALQWCRERNIPSIFWNKEDPIHFETFLTTAQQFDYVFTTDIDCIARYKAALGHERVYLLPFACQPVIHNPVEYYQRKDAFCFAGAYYVRYPERTKDLEAYIEEFPKFKPLEIYDRNFGKDDVNYQFPADYQPFIVGTLPFNEIDKAYKGYRYAINLNSIKQSQTMFARRVYELLGSNTVTVSNFSRGVRTLFGDLVVSSDSGQEIIKRLQALEGENEQKLRLAGLRKVMLEHTYQHRWSYIANRALGRKQSASGPQIVAVALVNSAEDCRRILDSFKQQTYTQRQLLLVSSVPVSADMLAGVDAGQIRVLTLPAASPLRLADVVSAGQWLAPLHPADYYGKNYLLDMAIATGYGKATLIGKPAHFHYQAGAVVQTQPAIAYHDNVEIPRRGSLASVQRLTLETPLLDWLQQAAEGMWSEPGLAIDPFNYCRDGQDAIERDVITERVDDLSLDLGLSIEEILRAAEQIGPAEFDEARLPKWNASKLDSLCKLHNHPHLGFAIDPAGLLITSSLPDGKHEYVYAREDIPVKQLPAVGTLETFLDATPGLNIQYVFLCLDANKKKLGHSIHTANRNHSAKLAEGTAFVRFGWRVAGSGQATVKNLLWGHRKQEPARLLGRSSTLLLTNHYPSYEDLYRNGFVHSRVKAYAEQGVQVDVFRLRPDDAISYHEFQNVDVVSGSQQALHKLLESGKYRNVLVHFLSPEMWQVLNEFPAIRKTIWLHGAEIQPWHRRDYNFENEQERNKAIRESALRMAFWREMLQPFPENLKLVFVSKYFAEEVFEDLGFRIPEDRYTIIHNPIDTDLFSYQPKPVEQRKRILSIRPYASRKYANDLSVEAILQLSQKPFFHELEFRLIGDGKLFEEILAPLRGFPNVIIERRFLSQGEIASLHRDYGLFLVPTRMDAQGVSRDEAMASGLIPLTNAVAAIPEFVDEECGILAPAEDATNMADGIANLVSDPELFSKLSRQAARRVKMQSAKNIIVAKELQLLRDVCVSGG